MARILVVDDHPHIRRLIQRELAAEANEVLTAGTGEEALRLAREVVPELVILDIMLPGMDGLSVLRAIRADLATRSIRVILLTAKDQPDEISRGLELGADWYLTKPFAAGDIAALARRFLAELPPDQMPSVPAGILPLREIDHLTLKAASAFELALAGQVRDGYHCLAAELERSRGAQDAGCPWAGELGQRYEELLDHYTARFGPVDGRFAPDQEARILGRSAASG